MDQRLDIRSIRPYLNIDIATTVKLHTEVSAEMRRGADVTKHLPAYNGGVTRGLWQRICRRGVVSRENDTKIHSNHVVTPGREAVGWMIGLLTFGLISLYSAQ